MYGLACLALYVTAVIAHAQLPTLRAACVRQRATEAAGSRDVTRMHQHSPANSVVIFVPRESCDVRRVALFIMT